MEYKRRNRIPEAQVQAEFYQACSKANIKCDLEYKYQDCQFDAVIVRRNEIVCIVEIKSSANNKPLNIEMGQINQYRKFGIPLLFLTKTNQIKSAILAIRNSNWQDELFIKQLDIIKIQQNQIKPKRISGGKKASIGITMDRDLIDKLDNIEVGGTKRLPRSTKISLIVEQYIREHEEGEG